MKLFKVILSEHRAYTVYSESEQEAINEVVNTYPGIEKDKLIVQDITDSEIDGIMSDTSKPMYFSILGYLDGSSRYSDEFIESKKKKAIDITGNNIEEGAIW